MPHPAPIVGPREYTGYLCRLHIQCTLSGGIPMTRDELLSEIKARLQRAFGERLQGVVLYGSEARGEAHPDSDIDLLVLLTGPVEDRRDSWQCIDTLYPVVLETGRPIHAEPVDVHEYRAAEAGLYREAQREGVAL